MKRALLFLLLFGGAIAASGSELTEGWAAVADYKADVALRHFQSAEHDADTAIAREAKLGHGVVLLAKQPVTASQIDEARGIFRGLADSGDDDPAQAARFYLGRIAQYHQVQPDPVEAAKQYRQLIAEHEHSVWAQTALGRLALLEIYLLHPTFTPEQRVAEGEKLLRFAHVPEAEGELHIAVAEAIFFYRLPDQGALPHLLAAERLGGYDRVGRTDVLLQIAELSRLSGQKEQAAKYYHLYLKENPRDSANYNARRHLEEVEGEKSTAAPQVPAS